MSVMAKETSTNKPIQIVLIGATGSGKSSSGNTILGQNRFKTGTSAKSVTQKCDSATNTINLWNVTVVDTPGWDCTEITEHEFMSQIRQALQSLQGFYSLLLVIRISSMETEEEITKLHRFKTVLGNAFLDHTTILFSRSDDLEGKDFKDFIKEGGEAFHRLLNNCRRRYHCWNNRDSRSDEAVEKLLQDLKRTETTLQDRKISTGETASASTAFDDQELNAMARKRQWHEGLVTDKSENVIKVLFLGRNKVGKSSSIKTLCGKCDQYEGQHAVLQLPNSELGLKLIESPGFDESLTEIQKAISQSLSDCSPGPHVIIIVLSVERFTSAAKTAMKHVQECLGENARKHTMILFTGADNLNGKSIETFIQENQDLNKIVKSHNNRFHALNNRNTHDATQVEELLKKIQSIYQENNEVYRTRPSDSGHWTEMRFGRKWVNQAKAYFQKKLS